MDYLGKKTYLVIFLLFLLSGFCGLVYQIVWIRLGFTAFGVITPILSVVISIFMLGLALGSWASGRFVTSLTRHTGWSALAFYGLMEFLIGIGGLVVPILFSTGQTLLLPTGDFDSLRYLSLSAVILGVSILPWCIFMGATIPFMMAFIRQFDSVNKTGFSYLYLANVIGAMLGTLVSAVFLIELIGLRATSLVAVTCNFLIGSICFILNSWYRQPAVVLIPQKSVINKVQPTIIKPKYIISILFMTGFTSMAMEVVWTRAFTPVLGTTVYAYAGILAVYLLATSIGSWLYRQHNYRKKTINFVVLIICLSCFCLLPIAAGDPRFFQKFKELTVLVSIFPFCLALGYLTPKLTDEFSSGAPNLVGSAYAINTVGCILGPLLAGYLLLPNLGVKFSLILLAVPFVLYAAYHSRRLVVLLGLIFLTASTSLFLSYEDSIFYPHAVVRRDYAATVISYGSDLEKRLLVNGIGMTGLRTVTKFMAHFPLAIREKKPESALIICFGMGTTFRSAISWGIETTAVELIPSVREAFGFYFKDANEILKKPGAKVVVDDGRRYLRRTVKKFDLIVIDPPPPFESSCSGLLYSEEFYQILKTRLNDNAIMQQWLPANNLDASVDKFNLRIVTKAICAVFPHVRIFHVQNLGYHFFASMQPFEMPSTDTFAARIPAKAAADLIEWTPRATPSMAYDWLMRREITKESVLLGTKVGSITDDQPLNEYFLIRKLRAKLFHEQNQP